MNDQPQWRDPATSVVAAPFRTRRRRWPLIAATLTVVVVAVTGGAGWWLIGGGKDQWTRRHWQPPPQSLLSPMGVEPVPGWKASVNSLGLPSDARFTTSGDSTAPGPIITTSDSRTYVLATSGATDPQWWLAGVDARDGHRLFPPVALNAGQRPPSCFANGRAVVCVAEDSAAATAWVVDGDTGMLTYMGRTDLDLYSSKLRPRQLGDYLVAQTEREGVYGVGPDAAPTWFVGGVGVVASHNGGVAFQSRGEGLGGDLFAMTDGKIIHPDTPPDALVRSVRFFDAGFAAEVASSGGLPAVQLFDDAGRKTADVGGNQVVGTTANLTAVFDDDRWGIYAPDGARLLDLPREQAGGIQLIGSTLWVTKSGGAVHHSQPYDLRTGDPGKPCDIDFGGYLGSDGSVAVRAPLNPKSDDLAQAYDLATCRLAWSIPRPAGSLGRLVRTGDTLVRLSDTGTELASLVAPQ